ncbi:type II toxin-antitoxin system RelE/ParE family toxin [Xanthomonas sp. WHRI 7945]|nr:type II toxin-antitoxin system RelE/ParE family toxin [Xanthomonas campestris pv. campestris]
METTLEVRFYRSASGAEPVRSWLREEISAEARRTIGSDMKTVQLGWPLGMPLVRKMDHRLWEVRSTIPEGIARIFFTIVKSDMVLLHGIVKKSDKTPKSDLETAKRRRDEVMQ